MACRLEEITPGGEYSGIVAGTNVTCVAVRWDGTDVLTVTYREPNGMVSERLIFRENEAEIQKLQSGQAFSFDGDGIIFAWLLKLSELSWPTSSTPSWPFTHPRYAHCRIN